MQEFDQKRVEEECEKQQKQWEANLKKPTVLLCGQTGAGKSQSACYIFKENIAEVGHSSEPCTEGINYYPGTNVNIYDSEGYEIGSERQSHYRDLIFKDFLQSDKVKNSDGIQAVWYYISGQAARFTNLDEVLIKEFQSLGYHVAILITKIDEMSDEQLDQLTAAIQKAQLGCPIFNLSIHPQIADTCDWEKLVSWTYDILPEVFKEHYIFALKKGLEEKSKAATKAIWLATGAAATVGATPIPLSDAPILVGIQSVLIYKILRYYGVNISSSTISGLLSSLSVSQLGKMAAGSLLKLIPAAGQVVGGAINAAVAAAFTYALGYGINELCKKQAKEMMEGKEVTIDIEQILSSKDFIQQVTKMAAEAKGNILEKIKEHKDDKK